MIHDADNNITVELGYTIYMHREPMIACYNVTCVGKADHRSLQQQLNISANFSRQCVTIDITNDNVTEENEFFQISISLIIRVSGSSGIYQLHTPSATVTIIDDDCKTIIIIVLLFFALITILL